jgi:hypothetical protein
MMKILLLFGLLLTSLFIQADDSARADSSLPRMEQTGNDSGKVNFKGVSFSYNPQIFGKVKIEEINAAPLERADDKPGENFPKHVEFTFEKTQHSSGARIAIIPIANYRRMFAVSKGMTTAFDENLSAMQKVIKNKDYRVKNQIPLMPFYDAHQTFTAKVKHLSFQNGDGILFLTQIDHEASLINNEGLTCYFQGMTKDRRNYIFAVFSVKASFLPDSWTATEFEDYKLLAYYKEGDVKGYQEYVLKMTKRLENLPPEKYEPHLKYFEEIISSLKVKNKRTAS